MVRACDERTAMVRYCAMREGAFLRAHPKRLWIFLLPVFGACLAIAAAGWLGALPPSFPLLALALAAVALAFVEGILVSLDLPGTRALATRALQLQAVYDVISKAGRSLELQEVLDSITRLTVEVTGVRGCSIKLLDAAKGRMSVRSLAGLRRQLSELSAEAAESIATRSLLDGRPVLVEGAAQSDFPELDEEAESLICVPLRHEAGVVGALCVYGEKGKRLTAEMLSFLSRLGDLAVLSIENASVYETLKKIDAAKSWFMRKAAHELASPLSVVQSIAQNLLAGYLGGMEQRQRESVERIRARAAGLSEIVADLLALAKGKAQAPGGAAGVDLCVALGEAIAFFQPAAREKGIEIATATPCSPCEVAGTAEGIRSVLTNLVSNAVKYSPPGGRVTISLAPSDSEAELAVSDRGIGIPAAEKDRLFGEFFRASNARSFTESGTGLGMAIVKSVVDGVGGSLEVESEEGKGTTVRVRFPRRR